uniref:Uncharacterized protein n=1 Tax=Strombidium inclinatum TaxID=197538 RepID=A0A7S3IS41_9SPIT|mmetsp:Transcript_33640/g.51880  ORF Transcript_33640/g.51880 Transcript_33640/m.51880 type:complete len:121 (+) Transcript_33640:3142-3504(+)
MSPSSLQNQKQERQELEEKVKKYEDKTCVQKKQLQKLHNQIESMNFHSKNAITFFRFFKSYHVEKEKELNKKISSPPSSAAGYNKFRRMITRKTMIARQISFNRPVRTKTKTSIRFAEPL